MFTNQLARRLSTAKPETSRLLSGVKIRAAKTGEDQLIFELPQHLDLMSARLLNGEDIYSVLALQASGSGKFAHNLERLGIRLQLGENLEQALALLAEESKSPLVSEFVNKLQLGLSRGTPLATQFLMLSASAKAQLKVAQLKAAGRNELKMLIPLVFLILPVTIAFAVFPSLQLLQLGV
ncbi:MAG: type II secretion system F family protein [Actinomycetales bacterium]|nr:type II secretion system F family protein [Actinomycetales bacterium]